MKRRILLTVFVGIIFSSGIVAILSGRVSAAPDGSPAGSSLAYKSPSTLVLNIPLSSGVTVTDKQKVSSPVVFDNTTFTDSKILDRQYDYTSTQGNCKSTITLYPPPASPSPDYTYIGSPNALVTLQVPDALPNNPCLSYQYSTSAITDPGGVGVTLFDWTSANQITAVTDNILLGQDSTNHQHFVSGDYKDLIGNTCHLGTLVGTTNCTVVCTMGLTLQADNMNGDAKLSCTGRATFAGIPYHQTQVINFPNIKVGGSPSAPVVVPDAGGAGGQTPGSSPGIKCSIWSANPLNWFVCPILDGINAIMNSVGTTINHYLTVPGSFFDRSGGPNTTGGAIYTAWDSVRNISLALLGITALIMVLSQALSFGPFDAYTVKKVLPRILVAAILITVSWSLIQLLVAASNGLGNSVRSLIYAPFSSLGDFSPGSATLASGLVGGLGALGVLGIFGVLSLGLTAVIALLTGLAIIVIRQMLVILLAILAPVAIAAYILPGTDKGFKFWLDSLIGVLALFPIIEAIIALGQVFSKVAQANTGTGNSVFNGLIAFVALYFPYFVLPAVARRATGIAGTLSGMAHDGSKGISGRLSKGRAERAADRFKRAQGQSLWSPNTKRGDLGNKIATWATSPLGNLAYAGRNLPGLSGTGQKVAAQVQRAKVDQSSNLFKELNESGMFNDKAYRALSGAYSSFNDAGLKSDATDEAKAVRAGLIKNKFMDETGKTLKTAKSLDDINAMADVFSQGGDTERIAANALRGYGGRIASLYSDPEMGKAGVQAAGIMGLAAHGFAESQDIANVANQLDDGGKNTEYAAAIASRAQVMGQQSRPDIKAGYGVLYDKDSQGRGTFSSVFDPGPTAESRATHEERALGLVTTLSAHDLAAAKGGAIKALRPTIKRTIEVGAADGASAKAKDQAKAVREQLYSWAGPYSQASVDVKAQSLDIIRENGLEQEFRDTLRVMDPTVRTGPGPDPGDPGAGGGPPL